MNSIINNFKIILRTPDPINTYKFTNRPNLISLILNLYFSFLETKKLNKILILDLIKIIYSYAHLIIFFPLCIILFFFIKINNLTLLSINTWQIGALVQQLDSIIKKNPKKKFLLVSPNYLMAFYSYPKIYNKKNLIYFESIFLYFLIYPLLVFKLFSKDAFNFEVLNKKSEFNELHQINNYKYNFEKLFKNIKKKKFNKLITIHFKDDTFTHGSSLRVSNWKTYTKTIKWLLEKNFTVIRFIHRNSVKNIINHKKYFEIEINNDQDKIQQMYLIKNSKLFICNQSGPSSYNFIVNTPFLQVNSFPINVSFVCKSKDYLIFKKVLRKNKYIGLKEFFKYNFHLKFSSNVGKIKGFKLEDNSSSEILNATKDILLNKKSFYFAKILRKNSIFIPANYSRSKIPQSFMKFCKS